MQNLSSGSAAGMSQTSSPSVISDNNISKDQKHNTELTATQCAVTHLFILSLSSHFFWGGVISTVLLPLAAYREAFTPPTGPGTGVWHHPEIAICFFTNPTHCLAWTICCRKAVSQHRRHHKPFRGLPYSCMMLASQPSLLSHFSVPVSRPCRQRCCAMFSQFTSSHAVPMCGWCLSRAW